MSIGAISPEASFDIPEDDSTFSLNDIGKEIDTKYENKPTPLKVRKVITGVFAILSTIFTIATMNMAWYIPVIGTTAIVGSLYYLYTLSKRVDYDNPDIREKIASKVANQTLCQIVEEHPVDKVLGYDLLKATPSVYKRFDCLATRAIKAKSHFLLETSKVINEYNKNMLGFRNRVDNLDTQYYVINGRNNRETNIFDTVFKLINIVKSCKAQNELSEAQKVYGQEKDQNLVPIKKAYREQCLTLNKQFAQIR